MKIYMLTTLGQRMARTTNNPDTPAWRVIHYLDHVGHATSDQLAGQTGTPGIGAVLRRLKVSQIIKEVG